MKLRKELIEGIGRLLDSMPTQTLQRGRSYSGSGSVISPHGEHLRPAVLLDEVAATLAGFSEGVQ